MKIIERTDNGFIAEILSAEMLLIRAIEHKPETIDVGTEIMVEDIIRSVQETALVAYKSDQTKPGPALSPSVRPVEKSEPTEEEKRLIRERALAAFNNSKADRLGDNERRGQQLSADRDLLLEEAGALQKERETLTALITEAEGRMVRETADRDAVKALAENYDDILGRQELLAQKAEVEGEILAEKNGRSQDTDAINREVASLEALLNVEKANLDKFTLRSAGEQRVEELKTEEKTLAAEYERLERELFVTELFVKTKSAMLTDGINSMFELVRFRLFETQVNGNIDDKLCEIIYTTGASYDKGMSNAERIRAGMDIVRTLQRHYNVFPVLFVDNAESVCELVKMDCQVIRLVVSESDKVLRVEVSREQVAA